MRPIFPSRRWRGDFTSQFGLFLFFVFFPATFTAVAPRATVELDGHVDDVEGHGGHLDFDLAHRGVGLAAHVLVEQPRGVHHEQAGAVDGDPGIGDALAVAAEVGDRLAEGGA